MTEWEEREKAKKDAETKRLLWLRGLKPGDKMAMRKYHFGGISFETLTVARFTATQIIVEANGGAWVRRFDRKTGIERGAKSYNSRVEPVTQEVHDLVELIELRNWFFTLNDKNRNKKLSLKTLRALKAAIEPIIAADGGEDA